MDGSIVDIGQHQDEFDSILLCLNKLSEKSIKFMSTICRNVQKFF